MAMWFGADRVIRWFMRQEWFVYASGFSFFIFGIHVPFLPYLMKWSLLNFDWLPNYRLLTYLFVPVVVLALSVAAGAFTRRFLPQVYGLLTGGRGF